MQLTDSWVRTYLTGDAVPAAGSLGCALPLPWLRIPLPDAPVPTDEPRYPVARSSSQWKSARCQVRTQQCFEHGACHRRNPPLHPRIRGVACMYEDGHEVTIGEEHVSVSAVHRVDDVAEETET